MKNHRLWALMICIATVSISLVTAQEKHQSGFENRQVDRVYDSPGMGEAALKAVVVKKMTGEAIREAISSLPSEGGEVILLAGTYRCDRIIAIDRDNVSLRGAGKGITVLRLANGANSPVLVLGQTSIVPAVTRRNIIVSDLMIDGNRTNQSFECFGGECSSANPLRNNGVSLRRVEDVLIERVAVVSARSGGLVSELVCRRLTVRDFSSSDNHFDGLAGYETEDSLFSGLYLFNNLAAGLSFDIAFNHNMITETVITGNAKVGVFMRDSRENVFSDVQIRNSGEHGLFLAQVESEHTAASGNTFTGLIVSDSIGAGLRVNDQSCINNAVSGAQFIRNRDGCISESIPGLVHNFGAVCR